jgi:hypothetical protein
MPIEVHCPNPGCAKVHLVKDKYAGMRGKCPACDSWMYIPREAAATMIAPRPAELEAAAVKKRQETARSALSANLEEEPLPVRKERNDRPKGRRLVEDDEPVVEAEAEEDEAPAKPVKRFGWLAPVLLFLGILSLGAVAATPYLDIGKVEPTGGFVPDYAGRKLEGIKREFEPYVTGVAGGVAGLGFLSLLIGLITRRVGFVSLFLLYVATLLAAAMLFLALSSFRDQLTDKKKLEDRVERAKEAGKQGDVEVSLGQFLYAGLAGTAGACLFFTLAAVVMHRRWWSRILGFLFLGAASSLGAVWIYRKELGIEALEQYLPF